MDKKILVTQSSMPSFEEYCAEIKPIWEVKLMTNMGPIHNKLKSELTQYMAVENLELFVNGHQALVNALRTLDIKGEVITSPFTFASTTNSIIEAGLTPVFCDININDYTINVDKIESLITANTVAIMPIHVYGSICDVEAIAAIASRHKLKVVYDAAHAFGVSYNGKGIGTYGDISMFSFHATKVYNTIEGGCLTFADKNLSKIISKYRNFGIYEGDVDIDICGSNAKMNEFQAAMGICNLKYLAETIAKRKAVSETYDKYLKGVYGLSIMDDMQNLVRNYAYYPLIIDETKFSKTKSQVLLELKNNNIFAREYFTPAMNDCRFYKGKYRGETPIAHWVSQRVICLPMYSELDLLDVERISNIILSKN